MRLPISVLASPGSTTDVLPPDDYLSMHSKSGTKSLVAVECVDSLFRQFHINYDASAGIRVNAFEDFPVKVLQREVYLRAGDIPNLDTQQARFFDLDFIGRELMTVGFNRYHAPPAGHRRGGLNLTLVRASREGRDHHKNDKYRSF